MFQWKFAELKKITDLQKKNTSANIAAIECEMLPLHELHFNNKITALHLPTSKRNKKMR